jgi:REP element-mobilizing transposase RayT
MENHLHLIASSDNLARDIASFKSFTARRIIDYLESKNARSLLQQLQFYCPDHKLDSTYQLWQEGSHPEEIQRVEMMRQKTDYIHLNPVRRGYVEEPEEWRYSSARNYAGRPGLLEVLTDWT